MHLTKRLWQSVVLTLLLTLAWLMPLFGTGLEPSPSWLTLSASAASVDYPVTLMHIATKDNAKVLTADGTADGASISAKALGSDLSASWRMDRVGTDSKGTFFKFTNAQSGRLLTPKNYQVSAGTSVILYGSESAQSQHWYVIPVQQDAHGNDLYYKIVNYSDTSLALTQGTSGMTLSNYTGADSQLWLLNPDGLQGFAGYCKDDNTGAVKAADIGGLFGEVVEVSTFDQLKEYAESDTPYTILVTADIRVTGLTKDSSGRYYCPDGRIYVHDNKTIVGSYGAHTLYNVQFCTSSSRGTGNNLIIKNFELQHDAESNGNDSIVVYFGSGQNLWVDHCTFVGHSDYNTASTGLEDWDKFLACCYDADYCTVSDSSFGLHEYGLILGYPGEDNGDEDKEDGPTILDQYNNFPRMTLAGNRFEKTLTRAPGLMRYGYFHSLNNYVNDFSMGYTVHTASKIFAENCRYENGGNIVCDWNEITYPGSFADSGSSWDSSCGRTDIGSDSRSTASACTWRPTTNYDYVKLSASAAKTYCTSYSGAQSSKNNMMYLRMDTPGVPSAGYTEAPGGEVITETVASFLDGETYRIRNVGSGLYLQVAGAAAENGANVQQWGSDGTAVHDIWKFFSAGDGYYYLASAVGDGGTYVLDVAAKGTADGTNIDIYQYNGGTNQQFKLVDAGSGTYQIRTKITGDASVIEVADGSTASGANVQQWTRNGASCQEWELEPVTDPGCSMDTGVMYTFENANSGLVMDIQDANMADNTNVRQWESNGADCQKWILRSFGSGNYYWIRSVQDNGYALKAEGSANGANIDIVAFSTRDSAQLFRFTKNLDGTYGILSHASGDTRLVEVESASMTIGANVGQWEPTGSACQKWKLITEEIPAVTTTTAAQTTTTTTTKTTTTVSAAATTTHTNPATTEKIVTSTTTTASVIPGTSATVPTTPTASGDVNGDGVCSIADVILLQRWLLGGASLTDWRAGDLNGDYVINAIDLAMMRLRLIAA